ncbi:glutathione transferase GstA [Azohydromonas caseinilytica]|uniref:Glutathione transferase GstA n=1 Tax=Azohydromonas caseinilytica TaxID=2728836 RepID=A0A848F5R1_9BURK|nr:glutathione transferase GstA [Azohydromonas caseinilytica]NML13929.1 glutathione transferase GstA [Azohydromonas caseinilytica]
MKLYYSPGACSLSPHIVLHEAGLPCELVLASTKTKKLEDGTDFYAINPKGSVPVLELDDGQRLTEGPAVVQYLADLVPERRLAPPAGTLERYRLMEWLNFITSELHKSFSVFFTPGMPEDAKTLFRDKLRQKLQWVDGQLAGKSFLLGEDFSVADAYLFTVARWADATQVDIAGLANLQAFRERVSARPSAQAAMKHEGLIKQA